MSPLLLFSIVVLLALAAPRYGVDSRWSAPGEAPRHRGPTPRSDLAAALRWLRGPVPAARLTARGHLARS